MSHREPVTTAEYTYTAATSSSSWSGAGQAAAGERRPAGARTCPRDVDGQAAHRMSRDLKRGTLHSILKQAGLTEEELLDLL